MASKKTDDGDRAAKAKADGLAKKAAKAASQNQLKPSELPAEEKRPPRLRNFYKKEIAPNLLKELGLKNPMQVPRLMKIVVNMGLGDAVRDPKILEGAAEEMA